MHWLDPSVLPSVDGRIATFTRNPKGDVDGMLLDDDRHIHVPPHMGAKVEKLFATGDRVEARYVKPRHGDVHAAVSVTHAASGRTLLDDGPPSKHDKHAKHDAPPKKPPPPPPTKTVELAGVVRRTLHAPKGEVCGAVLESGEQLRVAPKENAELAPYFAAGTPVRVWGEAMTKKGTTVVDVASIAFE